MDGKKGAERADGVDQTTTIQEEGEEREMWIEVEVEEGV